jgi:hypothetical protein
MRYLLYIALILISVCSFAQVEEQIKESTYKELIEQQEYEQA